MPNLPRHVYMPVHARAHVCACMCVCVQEEGVCDKARTPACSGVWREQGLGQRLDLGMDTMCPMSTSTPAPTAPKALKPHVPWTCWPTDVSRPPSPVPTHMADPQRQGLRQPGGRLCLGPTARLLLSKANSATATNEHLPITSRGHLQASKGSRTWCRHQSFCGKLSPGNSSDWSQQGPLTSWVRPALADALASEMHQNKIPRDIHLEEKGGAIW